MARFLFIDVLRGLAILLVMWHHLPLEWAAVLPDPWAHVAAMGGRGVDLFFVLSGFLICSTALRRAGNGQTAWAQTRAYLWLRAMRIWPLYALLLGFYVLAAGFYRPEVGETVVALKRCYLTFTSNDCGQPHLELGIFWSLAIEEQFYFIVGVLIALAAVGRDRLAGAFVGMGIAAICVALRTRFDLTRALHAGALDPSLFTFKLYHSTLARMDQLAFGMLAATAAPWLNKNILGRLKWAPRLTSFAAIAGLGCCLMRYPSRAVVEFTCLGLVAAVTVLWCQRPAVRQVNLKSLPGLAQATHVVARAGKLSFGLYMLHPIARHLTSRLFDTFGLLPATALAPLFFSFWLGMTWMLAEASFRLLETPLLDYARQRGDAVTSPKGQDNRPAALPGKSAAA